MGQDLSQFTENVPSLVKDTLRRIGQEVAMDLHENSIQTLVEDDDDVEQEEAEAEMMQRMTMASPDYFGIWQDDKGRPFYYDVKHQAYFFLEQQQHATESSDVSAAVVETMKEEKKTNDFYQRNIGKDDEELSYDNCSSSSSNSSSTTTTATIPRPVSHINLITNKIMTDLQIIYSNVSNSIASLLHRGQSIEQTRQKLNEMMDTASSLERQSRCLSCAHRCGAVWPSSGFIFILKIADLIPMSACCQDDGVCGPYVFMSEDDDDDINEFSNNSEVIHQNLVDHHLE